MAASRLWTAMATWSISVSMGPGYDPARGPIRCRRTMAGQPTPVAEARMPSSVIVSSARTPMGKLSGSLASFKATDLGGIAIQGALERAGLAGDRVDYVFMG